VTRDSRSKMHFVRLGLVENPAQEERIIQRLPAIVTALRMVYDIVVINVGEARASAVPVLSNADATLLMASQARIEEAADAAGAFEEAGNTKTLLLRLEAEPAAGMPIKATA
jgi:hypothetical protein